MTNANVNAADTRHYDGGSWAHILVTHTSPPTQQCQPMSLAGDGNGTSSTNQVWATASSPQMVQLSRRRTSGRTPEHPRPTTTTATRRAKGRHRRVPLCRPPPSNSEQLIVMAAYRQRRHPRLHTKSDSPVGYRCPRWPGENSRSLIGIDALTRMAMGAQSAVSARQCVQNQLLRPPSEGGKRADGAAKRASNAGHSRSLAVTAGHSKTHPDQ